jgi:hypothetical protein
LFLIGRFLKILSSETTFGLSAQAVSEENIKTKSANQKQELPVATMFVNGSEQNEQPL